MSINNAQPASFARKPRCRLLTNGTALPCVSVEITSVGNYHCDTFDAEFSLNASNSFGLSWWGEQASIPIDVQLGFDNGSGQIGWTSIFQGEVDAIDGASLEKGTVSVKGRDLTRRLLDAKTDETFQNKTSSQIATILAQRHNLTPLVTATKTFAGRYYSLDHDTLTLGQFHKVTTEWDLLVWLAQREGFEAFVQGSSLYFQPKTQPNANPYTVRWTQDGPFPSSNVQDLKLTRALTLASDIIVKVRSWRSADSAAFAATARGTKTEKGASEPQTFTFVYPNMTQSEAQDRANALLAEA